MTRPSNSSGHATGLLGLNDQQESALNGKEEKCRLKKSHFLQI